MSKISSFRLAGRWLVILAAVSLSRPSAAEDAEYGICEEQIAADMKTRFGQRISRVDWSFETAFTGESGLKSQALVFSDACPGYHVYDVFATIHDCLSRTHYGTTPNYIRFRVSEAGC